MITRYLAAGLLACVMSFSALAQQTLADMVAEASAEWMFGQWQAQTENGDSITLNVAWELDKNVVLLHVKGSNMESKGYTVMEPKSEFPKYYSFDNRGSVGKGSWNMESGELVLRVESETADRGTRKTAFVFAGSASAGLEVRMHSVEDSGSLSAEPRFSLKFKKQK